jgi:methylenetetrahydrofolate--tRNA-(uracil-5-)-methyltransferase
LQARASPAGTGADYLNCPMNKEQYEAFVDALIDGDKTDFKEWEANTPYFDGCLPIEVMAERGRETLRHGPMKPMGLTNPRDPLVKSHAVVQLRQDNALGTLFNMVGFQTKLKYGDQARILRLIPGLENAEFARLGARWTAAGAAAQHPAYANLSGGLRFDERSGRVNLSSRAAVVSLPKPRVSYGGE